MGCIRPDGLPEIGIPIGESNDLWRIGLHPELVHHIEVGAHERPSSSWRITGTRSSLTPYDRDMLIWQPLTGPAVRFAREKIGRRLTASEGGRWLIRWTAPDCYEIRTLDGYSWQYTRGLLASAVYPALGELRFTTLGQR